MHDGVADLDAFIPSDDYEGIMTSDDYEGIVTSADPELEDHIYGNYESNYVEADDNDDNDGDEEQGNDKDDHDDDDDDEDEDDNDEGHDEHAHTVVFDEFASDDDIIDDLIEAEDASYGDEDSQDEYVVYDNALSERENGGRDRCVLACNGKELSNNWFDLLPCNGIFEVSCNGTTPSGDCFQVYETCKGLTLPFMGLCWGLHTREAETDRAQVMAVSTGVYHAHPIAKEGWIGSFSIAHGKSSIHLGGSAYSAVPGSNDAIYK